MLPILFDVIAARVPPVKGECARLFHGRGKKWPEFSHLSIDFYPPVILITTYKEMTSSETTDLLLLLAQIPGLSFDSIFLQKRFIRGAPVEILKGEMKAEYFAVENSEKYGINLKNPQNIGFFLDMAIGRNFIRDISSGKRVLNLFAYTCSLSVAALKGGAIEVVNIDMSKSSLLVGEKNHEINEVAHWAKFIPYDIMKSFANIKRRGPYDLVIIDPPTNQGESFKAERDYHKIVRKLSDMTNPGATVMACLNSPHLPSSFITDIFKEHAAEFIFVEKIYSSFSEMENNPEAGLKILLFKKVLVYSSRLDANS